MSRISEAIPSTLRKINIRLTLELLKREGECSRATLTRLAGVSAPTMSKLLVDLLAAGMVEEFDRDPCGKGRPSKFYRLAETRINILGVVIDISECRIVAAGLDGKVDFEEVRYFPTVHSDYEAFLDSICNQVNSYLANGDIKYAGIGVSVPGLIDCDGIIEMAPNLHLLDGKSLEGDLTARLRRPVLVMQEEYGMCLAEQSFGSAGGCGDFVMIDISSGLGMGVLCNNRYIHGASGFGGELGHITVKADGPLCGCGNRGCLETLGGDKAMAAVISQRLGREVKPREIVEAVKTSGLDVGRELDETLNYLAIGAAAAINIFNPEMVFFYGRLFDLAEDAFVRFRNKVKERALAPSFRRCQLRRSSVSKVQGAIAGICFYVFEQAGPRIEGN